MKNIMAILRRELLAYFTSPIGYIFMMVFVTISVGLYITSFFAFPMADMRPYFENLPLLLCVFIPAVTMRIWAEERKENTWEMLLTFPMKASELVLGKFFAALIFFALTLCATATVPMMLANLGDPDGGTIFGGYLGTLLLGAFFLALGIFFSGFFKDQIVAFVVTLLTCFLFFLLGTTFIASYIDDKVAGLGTLLSHVLGIFSHYSAFTRGVVDLADVVFFLAWTVVFLVLNVMYIDGRSRPGARSIFAGAVAICVAIGLVFNWIIDDISFGRFDLTENKIYTVSQASKNILRELDAPAQVKLYITPREEMPTEMKDLEQDIKDKLEELSVASGGQLKYDTVYLNVENLVAAEQDIQMADEEEEEKTEEEIVEKRMLDKGVEPFNVRAMRQDEVTSKLVYASLGVGYKDKPEEIIPRVMPQIVPELEYRLVSTVYKLTREEPPVVALIAPKEAINIDPQMRQMLMQMGQEIPQSDDPYIYLEQILREQKYEVRRVELTKESPLPEDYDTLVVVNPRGFNERQRWEIARAIHSGKPTLLAVQQYEWDYRATPRGNTVSRREESPEINPLLEDYGLGVSKDILMDDANSVPLTVQTGGLDALLGGGQPFDLPMHLLVTSSSMDQDMSITNRLAQVFYLWGTPLEIDEEKLGELGLEYNVLMRSSDQSWTVGADAKLTGDTFKGPGTDDEQGPFPLMAMVEGQFPNPFEGEERPAWPKPQPRPGQPPLPDDDEEEPPAESVEAAPSKLILVGCSEMFRKNFIQAGNLDLFLNSVDALSLSENLVHVRGRKPVNRVIEKPSEGEKAVWRLANYGLANLIIAAIGIGVFVMRKRSRNAYSAMQARREAAQGGNQS